MGGLPDQARSLQSIWCSCLRRIISSLWALLWITCCCNSSVTTGNAQQVQRSKSFQSKKCTQCFLKQSKHRFLKQSKHCGISDNWSRMPTDCRQWGLESRNRVTLTKWLSRVQYNTIRKICINNWMIALTELRFQIYNNYRERGLGMLLYSISGLILRKPPFSYVNVSDSPVRGSIGWVWYCSPANGYQSHSPLSPPFSCLHAL